MAKNKLAEGIKFGISTIAGIGVTILMGTVTGSIINKNSMNVVKKGCAIFGASIISAMLASKAEDYVSNEIDTITNTVGAIRTAVSQNIANAAE